MSGVYSYADKALKRMYDRAEAEFQNLAVTADWDELRITGTQETVNALYERLEEMCEEEYLYIAKRAYREAKKEVKIEGDVPNREPDELFIFALLTAYDAKTQYRYDREWQRKRDRLTESLIAVTQKAERMRQTNTLEVRTALQRALNLAEKQMLNMAETVTDEARTQAFDDLGIEKVKWNTQLDGKVCAECRARNGQVYPIYQVPGKHPRCRCYLTPEK